MKKILLFFIVTVIGLHLFSQPAIKVFAFEQESLPGTRPVGVKDENGNPVKKAAIPKNYFIFISFKKTYSVAPVQIFIRGKAFNLQTSTVKKFPVEHFNNNIPAKPEKTILVPYTNDKVLEIKTTETKSFDKKTASLKKLTDKNDVVIAYVWKKKRYFITLKSLKKLHPVFNE